MNIPVNGTQVLSHQSQQTQAIEPKQAHLQERIPVIIYSPSRVSKPVCLSFLHRCSEISCPRLHINHSVYETRHNVCACKCGFSRKSIMSSLVV